MTSKGFSRRKSRPREQNRSWAWIRSSGIKRHHEEGFMTSRHTSKEGEMYLWDKRAARSHRHLEEWILKGAGTSRMESGPRGTCLEERNRTSKRLLEKGNRTSRTTRGFSRRESWPRRQGRLEVGIWTLRVGMRHAPRGMESAPSRARWVNDTKHMFMYVRHMRSGSRGRKGRTT